MDSLPANATAVVVAGQNYYVADGVYYQECSMGSDAELSGRMRNDSVFFGYSLR